MFIGHLRKKIGTHQHVRSEELKLGSVRP